MGILLKMLIVSFNTQPPEGGWKRNVRHLKTHVGFNTQPPEGGWTTGRVKP